MNISNLELTTIQGAMRPLFHSEDFVLDVLNFAQINRDFASKLKLWNSNDKQKSSLVKIIKEFKEEIW